MPVTNNAQQMRRDCAALLERADDAESALLAVLTQTCSRLRVAGTYRATCREDVEAVRVLQRAGRVEVVRVGRGETEWRPV